MKAQKRGQGTKIHQATMRQQKALEKINFSKLMRLLLHSFLINANINYNNRFITRIQRVVKHGRETNGT